MLEKDQRKALRREAKEIRENFAQLWGDDAETRKKRESLQARYAEIEQILFAERKRVLAECRQVWEDYAALRADQDEERENLMARYKELYHILRKDKEDKSKIPPGSDEDIPSPRELADGKQPPGSEVVFDFSSFIVSEEHSGPSKSATEEKPGDEVPISDRATVPGKPLPTFSESGEVKHHEDEPEEDASPAASDDTFSGGDLDFTIPSLQETRGLPLMDPGDFNVEDAASPKLQDEVWVENEDQAEPEASRTGLDELDLDDLLGGGQGVKKTPAAPEAAAPEAAAPEKPRPEEQKTQLGSPPPGAEKDESFLDATWDSSPELQFPQAAKRDEAFPPLKAGDTAPEKDTAESDLPPLQDFEQDNHKGEDNTTDSGSWDAMQRNARKQTSGKESHKEDDDDGDVIFG